MNLTVFTEDIAKILLGDGIEIVSVVTWSDSLKILHLSTQYYLTQVKVLNRKLSLHLWKLSISSIMHCLWLLLPPNKAKQVVDCWLDWFESGDSFKLINKNFLKKLSKTFDHLLSVKDWKNVVWTSKSSLHTQCPF